MASVVPCEQAARTTMRENKPTALTIHGDISELRLRITRFEAYYSTAFTAWIELTDRSLPVSVEHARLIQIEERILDS